MSIEPRIIPFQVGKPITDPADFAGRREILQEISTAMLNMQNVSLHGERRTGKTSLLCYLAHPTSSSAIGLPETHIPVYIDFQAFAGASAASVWQAMTDAIAEQVRQRCPDRRDESEEFLTIFSAPRGASEPSITDFGRALSYLGTAGLKIHLLLDEFDQTISNPNLRDSFYDVLRSLPTGRGKSLSYIAATRTGLVALQPVYNKASSPFFNIFTRIILRPFSEDEAHHLIFDYFSRAGLNLSLAEKLCTESSFLRDVTGYHPFFLQTLCYHLCAHLDKPDWPLGQARQEALRAFERDSEEHFAYYWKQSSGKERELMEKIALKEPLDRNRLKPVAKHLRDRCLVVPPDSGWQLVSSAFARWIQKPATLYSAGIEYLNRQSWEEAVAAFQEIIRIDPAYKDAQRRLDEATERARKIEDLEALYRQSKAYFEKGQWEIAITYLRRIADSGEQYKDASTLLAEAEKQLKLQTSYTHAEVLLKEGKWEEAIAALEEVANIDRTYRDFDTKLNQARVQYRLQNLYEQVLDHFREERWPKAIKSLRAILQEAPNYLDAAAKLGEAQKQQELAALYSAGVGFQETGRWEEAIDKFREIIRRAIAYEDVADRLARAEKQRELDGRFRQGEIYGRQGKWNEAVREFEQACAMDPNHQAVRIRLEEARKQLRLEELRMQGEASVSDGNWQRVVEVFTELRRLDPGDASVVIRLEEARRQLELDKLYCEGAKYLQRKRWRKARIALEKIVYMDADYRDAAAWVAIAREHSRRSFVIVEALRDPVWEGIGVIVAIIAFVIAGYSPIKRAFFSPVTPTPRPATLCNGNFEDDFECWQHGGELRQDVKCEEGQCYVVLGSPGYKCEGGVPVGDAWIKQSFQVPQTISPTLSLRYRVFSYDLDTYDFFQVTINGEPVIQSGNTEWTVSYCGPAAWDSGWQSAESDLSPYKGGMVEVSLRSVNGMHGWWNTWTYVDGIEVH